MSSDEGKLSCLLDFYVEDPAADSPSTDYSVYLFESPLGFIIAFLNASSSSLVRPPGIAALGAVVLFYSSTRSLDYYLCWN